MGVKRIVSNVLLAFVFVSIGYLIGAETGRVPAEQNGAADVDAPTNASGAIGASGASEVAAEQGHRLIAYYFHRTKRCKTCRTIETYAHDALAEGFPEAWSSGELQWRVANLDEPANSRFVDDFQIATSTVVLVELQGGERVAWRNLERVWELVGDELAFKAYVEGEALMYLEGDL